MEQSVLEPGGGGGSWQVVLAAWIVLVGTVSVATDFGLPGTAVGVTGLYFVYRGVTAVRLAVASRSVERTAIGELDGHADAVEIEGRARPAADPVTARMTETESVAYRVQVLQREPTSTE